MSRLSRSLLVFVLANVVVVNVGLMLFAPSDFRMTTLDHTWQMLSRESLADSWKPMSLARDYMRSGVAAPVYSELLIRQHVKFQYPPSALLLLNPLDSVRATPEQELLWLRWAGLFFVAATVAAVAAILGREMPPASSTGDALARLVLAAGAALTFYPLVKGYTLGQVQVWLNALLAASLWCWMSNRRLVAGFFLGVPCLVKPQYGLLCLWMLWQREWRTAAVCAVTVTAGLALSIGEYGLANHVDYLNGLSYLARHGEAFYPNQSFNGLMNRLWSLEDPVRYNNLEWREHSFPPYNPSVYATTLATSAFLVVACFLRRRREVGAVDVCIVLLTATLASPIAWEHHYGILLPIYAVLLPALLRQPAPATKLVVLGATYVLTSNLFLFANLLATTPCNVAQSYLFFGAIAVLVLLYGVRNRSGELARPVSAGSEPTRAR